MRNVVWFSNFRDIVEKHFALFVGFLCGCLGVLVDLDHPIAFLLKIGDGRFFHYPFFFATFFLFCGLFSYMAGLLCSMVLKKNRRDKCIIED
jgi:hypothetical protein